MFPTRPIPEMTPLETHRFWSHVRKSNGCWEWTRCCKIIRGKEWYGRFSLHGVAYNACRVSWFMSSGGFDPGDLFVCHRCDNPKCVRPDHLFLGTAADNMHDAMVKGRLGGERVSKKLTDNDVAEILDLIADGLTNKQIAPQFGIHPSYVSRLNTRKRRVYIARPNGRVVRQKQAA